VPEKTPQNQMPGLTVFNDENLAAPKKEKGKHLSLDKGMEELVGAICDPIIVFPGGWATRDFIPEWLTGRIKMDRLIELMVANKEGREPIGTDSEALAYMMPRTMEAPMGHDWTEIYLYLATKVCGAEGKIIPDDIRRDILTDDQKRDLSHLKYWLYGTKRKHRTEKAKDIRKERKEEEVAARKEAQPALFTF